MRIVDVLELNKTIWGAHHKQVRVGETISSALYISLQAILWRPGRGNADSLDTALADGSMWLG